MESLEKNRNYKTSIFFKKRITKFRKPVSYMCMCINVCVNLRSKVHNTNNEAVCWKKS